MNRWLSWLGLPVLAVVLVCGVLGVQLAHGGGSFEPTATADPCEPREVTSQADGIDGLTEKLVLVGIDRAACRLDVSREALTLDIADGGDPTDAQVDALQAGLLDAVDQLDAAGELPPPSDLLDEALDSADLNPFLETALRALPDGVVDGALDTGDVLTRAIEDLDVRELLANLDDQDDLNSQVQAAITDAVKDALVARLQDLV